MTDHPAEPCPRCGNAHDEPLCDDEAQAATAMQLNTEQLSGRCSWVCACDLAQQDDLVMLEGADRHTMERVPGTDVYVCYSVDHNTRTITVMRIRTLTGDSAPAMDVR